MLFDQLSINLIWASFILAFLTILIVGSQSREDSRSVAIWILRILVLMLLVICARLASSERAGYFNGGLGMVALCSALIAAVGLGYWIATLRQTSSQVCTQGKKVEPGQWDDELA